MQLAFQQAVLAESILVLDLAVVVGRTLGRFVRQLL